MKRRVSRSRSETFDVDGPLFIGVDDGDIGRASLAKGPSIDTQNASGVGCELLNQLRPSEVSRIDEMANRQGQERLDADDSEGGFVKLSQLQFVGEG